MSLEVLAHDFADREILIRLLTQVCADFRPSWRDRKIELFFADSYQDQKYRVWFFYVAGSPPKCWGSIYRLEYGYQVQVTNRHQEQKMHYVNLQLFRCPSREAMYNQISQAEFRRRCKVELDRRRAERDATNTSPQPVPPPR